ncbi:aldehyde dehydrogenase 1 precursor family protein [Hibiscus syriacus]|uniref:Aldehyde dehydrogenase 1 family protein n=1 Tax=Hibiscus syriacus TaxID=106335 RepID=A0A6A2YGS5_HIBSY|nr:uncharacterized protein LOC120165632 [Hibiscus syriacus]KAE8676529.1 aldehyde dehydrogenase 1 precursor family protein [Hibiscus syriacus]
MMTAAHIDVDPAITEETTSNSLLRNTRCCFCFPCFSSSRTPSVGIAFWHRITSTSSQVQPRSGFWTRSVGVLHKVREWSEIVAGPRWKTFIRRFNRNKSGSGGRHGQFQYDPLSYALNFDQGPGQIGDLEDVDKEYGGFRAFSTRYASVSGPEKTSLA